MINDNLVLELSQDIYDAGQLAFSLLTGVAKSKASDIEFNIDNSYEYWLLPQWKRASRNCKELLELMTMEDPRMRFTVDQVLQHPWIRWNVIV